MPKHHDLVDVSLLLIVDKAMLKAIGCKQTEDDKDLIWLPRSQIEYAETAPGVIEVTLPMWLAHEKRLI